MASQKAKVFIFSGASIITFFIFYIIILSSISDNSKNLPEEIKKYTSKSENSKCLVCHSSQNYTSINSKDISKHVSIHIPGKMIIDTNKYYNSNHWDFKCIDCHSDDYLKYPHDPALKKADMANCLDCHLGDPKTEKFHFEKIHSEYRKSTHFKNDSVKFSCWKCHDAHYFKIHTRNKQMDIMATIAYDNEMCLNCHNSDEKYKLFGKVKRPDMIKTHSRFPYLKDHFSHVRCIDCHNGKADSLLVFHNVMPKANAIKECNDCHSTNCRLTKCLYLNETQTMLSKYGFYNHSILKKSFIIGANHNYYFDLVCITLFCMIIAGLIIHLFLRIINK